jgi:energy-coupling factor transport system ATP-binding protein
MTDVAKLADRILVLNGARLAMDGTPAQVFSHAEELAKMGLDVPQITRVFVRLSEMGIDVPNVYTIEQAVEVLSRLRGGSADA